MKYIEFESFKQSTCRNNARTKEPSDCLPCGWESRENTLRKMKNKNALRIINADYFATKARTNSKLMSVLVWDEVIWLWLYNNKTSYKLMKIFGRYLGFTDFDIALTLLLSSVLRQYCMNYAALSNEEIESL